MKGMKKKIAVSALLSMLVLAGCGDGRIGGSVDQENKEFQIIMNSAWSGFSPLKTNDAYSTNITAQIYETLYRRAMDGTSFVPLLAKELPEYSEDGKTAVIKLREGVKFHDGTPFTSQSVKYVLEKIKDPDSGAARASIAASISSIECPDDTTVILHTSYPDGVLTAKLAHTNAAMFSPAADQKQDLMVAPVGSGPYRYVSSISGSEVKLTRNEDYWGEKPEIKDVKITVISEASTAISRLETGEADFMADVPVTQTKRMKGLSSITFKAEESGKTTYLAMRTDTAAHPETMMDLNVRKAIAYAIDFDGYITTLDGYASHSNSLLGPKIFGYTEKAEEFGYHHNMEEAKKLVQKHNLQNKEIIFVTSNVAATQTLAEYIQSNLKEAGFEKVKVEPLEYSSYLSETKQPGRFDITLLGWSNVTGDGSEYFEPNFSYKLSSKRIQWKSDELEQLIKEGKETIDKKVRIQKLEAANQLLLEEAIAVPIYNSYMLYAYSSDYDNIRMDPGQQFYISDIKYKK